MERLQEDNSTAPSWVPKVFGFLGALLVGEGIILFISANWRAIPNSIKLLLLFGTLLGNYFLADRLKFGKGPRPGLAGALFLKGAIAYGAGIFLIAQLYHFHAEWRTGLLYWFFGALPLAYALDSRPVLWLSLGTLYLWLTSRFWEDGEVLILLQALGAILVLIAVLHRQAFKLLRFTKVYFVLGSATVLATTLGITLLMSLREFRFDLGLEEREFRTWQYTLLGLYAVLFLGILSRRLWLADRALRWVVLFLPLVLAPGIYLTWIDPQPGNRFLLAVILLFSAECLGLMFLGDALGVKAYLNLGVVFFVVLPLYYYFDERWEYLSRSIFFLAGGVGLIALGYWLDTKRRHATGHEGRGSP